MSGLKRVSFRKGRKREPRLSQPYVPGKRHARFWTDAELAIVRDHYVEQGVQYCVNRLPGRSVLAIYQAANKLGLRGQSRPHTRRRGLYGEIDAAIRAEWHTLTDRGAVAAFAARIGHPRWLVSRRARALGMTKAHCKEPPWTKAELRLLRTVPLHDPDLAARKFRAHGFNRTATAIVVKAKRENLSRRDYPFLNAGQIARILGVDTKTPTVWIFEGLLKAGRRKTKRLAQQGGHWHSVEPSELRRFVIDNIDRIDIRKVDKHAFVELLTNPANLSPARRKAK